MGGHDHHHHEVRTPPVPDASIYKIEEVPKLVKFREKLATEGLHDPWMRNYMWRYKLEQHPKYRSYRSFFFTGWKIAIPAFILTIGLERYFGVQWHYGHDEHGHDDH